MESQVTSVEQSKRLLELGVPSEKASLFWFRQKISPTDWGEWELLLGALSITRTESNELVPAFTVMDLLDGDVVSSLIDDGCCIYKLVLESAFDLKWLFYYRPVTDPEAARIGVEYGDNLIDLLCNRVEWLVSNGYDPSWCLLFNDLL